MRTHRAVKSLVTEVLGELSTPAAAGLCMNSMFSIVCIIED